MSRRLGGPAGMRGGGRGYAHVMGIVNRVIEAILTIVTAPFRALGALLGRRGAGRRRT